MKKSLLPLLLCLILSSVTDAKELTFDFVANDYGLKRSSTASIESQTVLTDGDVAVTLVKDVGKVGFRLIADGLQCYKNSGAMIYVGVRDGSVSSIELFYESGAMFGLNPAFEGIYDEGLWVGSVQEVAFDYLARTNAVLKAIKVTYTTDGGSIVDPGPGSDHASSIAEFIGLTPQAGNEAMMNCDVSVAYAVPSAGYYYVCDASGATLLHSFGLTYKTGNVIPGGWVGKAETEGGIYRIVPVGKMPESTATESVVYPVMTDSPAPEMLNSVIRFKGVKFTSPTPFVKSDFSGLINGVKLSFCNNFSLPSVSAGTYDVLAAVAKRNGEMILFPLEYDVDLAAIQFLPSGHLLDGSEVYFTLQGVRLAGKPTVSGVYVCSVKGKRFKILVLAQ